MRLQNSSTDQAINPFFINFLYLQLIIMKTGKLTKNIFQIFLDIYYS